MKKILSLFLFAAMLMATPAFADEEAASESNKPEVAKSVDTGDGPKADFKDRTTGNKLFIKKGAHPAKQGRPLSLDVTVGANWWMADAGVMLDIPLVPNGFSPLNDSFELEIATYVGLSWHYGNGYTTFNQDILAGVRYSFYLTPQWTVYIRTLAGVGYWAHRHDGAAYFAWDESIGAYWNFAKNCGMRFDLGYHGVNVGLSFKFGSVGSGK